MFTNISWTDYLLAIFLVSAIYYVFIAIRFYYHELKGLAGKRSFQLFKGHQGFSGEAPNSKHQAPHSRPFHAQDSFDEVPDAHFQEVEHLIGRLKATINEASHKKQIKEALFQNLASVLRDYPELKNSPFRSAIHELLVTECAQYGPDILTEEEAVMLWDEVC